MKNRLNIVLVTALLIVSYLFYWQYQQGQVLKEELAAVSEPAVEELADTGRHEPPQFTLFENVNDSMVPQLPPNNNEELWLGYTEEDQIIIRDFDSRYFNALTFVNEKQYEWMVRHGYPTPEEILAASKMSTEELKSLADFGNTKAAMFLSERYLAEAVALAEHLTATGESLNEDYTQMLTTAEKYGRNFALTGSAFAGYMEANFQLERWSRGPGSSLKGPVEFAFKGFAYAKKRGDHTAQERAVELAKAVDADLRAFYRFGAYHKFLENVAGVGCGSEGWGRAEMMPSNKVRP